MDYLTLYPPRLYALPFFRSLLVQGSPDMGSALFGFSSPVSYFLIGILTLGIAVSRSGLAERLAIYLIQVAGGSPRMLYWQMLFSFAALTFMLPSASTRTAIMYHVYRQVLEQWGIPRGASLSRAVMLAMATLNRLGSTALLAGGITPVVASGLLGDFSWTRWFLLMALPFYVMLVVGGALIYVKYHEGFGLDGLPRVSSFQNGPFKIAELKAGLIVLGTALLWFTDFAHDLSPSVPALIAMAVILTPGLGVLSWREFEENLPWATFFVLATSLSLANVLVTSGAATWFSDTMVGGVEGLKGSPLLVMLALAGASAVVRLVVPNIAGYLALVIPVAMSVGDSLGLNPLVCGMAVVVVGDAVVYYPAQTASSIFVLTGAEIRGPEVFRFGVVMTLTAVAVLFAIALPLWGLLGESLTL